MWWDGRGGRGGIGKDGNGGCDVMGRTHSNKLYIRTYVCNIKCTYQCENHHKPLAPMCMLCYTFCIPINGRNNITQKGHAQLLVSLDFTCQ